MKLEIVPFMPLFDAQNFLRFKNKKKIEKLNCLKVKKNRILLISCNLSLSLLQM